MKRSLRGMLIATITLVAIKTPSVQAQQLTLDYFPSEDQLYEAYLNGTIDEDEYNDLRVIIESPFARMSDPLWRLTSRTMNFSAERPHASALWQDALVEIPAPPESTSYPSMAFAFSWRHRDHESSDNQYRGTISARLNSEWRADITSRHEYDGDEQFAYRRLAYHSESTLVKRFEAGSLDEQFGLGTVVGYAPRRLKFDTTITTTSFLNPDRGGQNGAVVELGRGQIRVRSLVSSLQDEEFSLRQIAGNVELRGKRVIGMVTTATHRVLSRQTGMHEDFESVASTCALKGKRSRLAGELAIQSTTTSPVAFLIEGETKHRSVRAQFAFWSYDSAWTDLFSSGTSMRISQSRDFAATGLRYRERHAGQVGGTLGLFIPIASYDLQGTVVTSHTEEVSTRTDLLSGISGNDTTSRVKWRIEYLGKGIFGNRETEGALIRRQEVRFETKANWERFSVGDEIRFHHDDEREYLSLRVNGEWKVHKDVALVFWVQGRELDETGIKNSYALIQTSIGVHEDYVLKGMLGYRKSQTDFPTHTTYFGASLEKSL